MLLSFHSQIVLLGISRQKFCVLSPTYCRRYVNDQKQNKELLDSRNCKCLAQAILECERTWILRHRLLHKFSMSYISAREFNLQFSGRAGGFSFQNTESVGPNSHAVMRLVCWRHLRGTVHDQEYSVQYWQLACKPSRQPFSALQPFQRTHGFLSTKLLMSPSERDYLNVVDLQGMFQRPEQEE